MMDMDPRLDLTLDTDDDSLLYPEGAMQFTAVVLYNIDTGHGRNVGHALVFVAAVDADHAAEVAEDNLDGHLMAHGYEPGSFLTTTILLFDGHQEAAWDANFDLIEEPPEGEYPDDDFDDDFDDDEFY